ncbi:hypothetical protein WN51_03363 [Melipona quadrifasciata]|uniref:Uncharacterized protein n=1 Tax=Melipona quadrifasciata TaxID=166423 RepID=A0A0N0BDU0_9HYME|nr:hypothetical protein WN51_03363 [Melipona quadrifasciata]
MEEFKRPRLTKESTVHDIASSIREISESVSAISEKYRILLKVNKALVLYMQNDKKRQQISALNDIQSDLEQTRLASD